MIDIPSYIITIILGGLITGTIGVIITITLFPKIGLLDFPERYGLTRKKLPYPAGIMISLLFILFVFILSMLSPEFQNFKTQIYGFLTALSLLSIVSFLDDRKQISPIIRLFIQSISALLVIYTGTSIEFITNPFASFSSDFSPTIHTSALIGGIITFFWIIGFINATNWSDGIPNLTISSGLIASLSLGILSFFPLVHQTELGILCFIFFSLLFPFLITNFHTTRFILGDSGSMTIGFCLAVFSLFSGGKMATLLITMSIPIFDSIYVISSRILEKKSPLKGGDGKHFHDYLLTKNWKEFHIFLLYFGTSILLGISVLFLDTLQKISVIMCSFCLFLLFRKFY